MVPLSVHSRSSWSRLMRLEIVWKLVSRPPSQRWSTYGMPLAVAASLMVSRACFLVPTKRMVPPRPASSPAKSCACFSSRSVFCRSMMWIPPRSPKMKRRILGFHRRVWWPKWTPASSSSLMPTSVAKEMLPCVCVWLMPAGRTRTRAVSRAGPRPTTRRGSGLVLRSERIAGCRKGPQNRSGAAEKPPRIPILQFPSGPPGTGSCRAAASERCNSAGGLDSQSTISPLPGCLNINFAACRNWRSSPSRVPHARPP